MKKLPEKFSRRAMLMSCGVTSVATLGLMASGLGLSKSRNSVAGRYLASQNSLSHGWASGATNLISVDYPTGAIFDSGPKCSIAVTKRATLGPCYFRDTTGEDISLGLTGLPMQLCIRLVDKDCHPLKNHIIEVWHCDRFGIYSGDTSHSSDASRFAGKFCTGGDEDAQNSTWFRGMLKTDVNGRVNFKSVFPGWYRGRTIHIHFAVVDENGNRLFISQFCFSDEFAKEICTKHELYADRGEQDTPLKGGRDTVFPRNGYEVFQMNVEKNSDNTLLAYHTIQLL